VSASVLMISPEAVGERMAGPAIRAYELARALAGAGSDVALAAPAPSALPAAAAPGPSAPPLGRIELIEAGFADFSALLAAARARDVVVAQQLPPTLLSRLVRLPTRLVVDLYNPTVAEVLEAVVARPPKEQRRIRETIALHTLAQCAAADFVLCASERQRDLWLGGMLMQGLVDLDLYRRDPSLRSLIDVVPFGIPSEPPASGGEPVLKGAWPGIAAEDRVLLWGGGVWSWLDALTPIRAVASLAERDGPATHLMFMGDARPGLERTGQAEFQESAWAEADRLGLLGRLVHVNRDWVPYAKRGAWLLESDLGISAHYDHVEARFSFRTRVLDYLWAGLPVVCTSGDALADVVEREGLGRTVPPGDPGEFADACAALLTAGERKAARGRIAALAPSLAWDEAVRPLAAWLADPPPRPRKRRWVVRRATAGHYRRAVAETAGREGPVAAARRIGRRVWRGIAVR
jgi:glycosyltransferase involved in cell wall biosynthesis